MSNATPAAEVDISVDLVRQLLQQQHPDLAELPLQMADEGWDNVMFRLGQQWVLRLPRREVAAQLVLNEQRFLPGLAAQLPIPISAPLRIGVPQGDFPWHWSVLPWFEGDTADVNLVAAGEAERFADFLKKLHQAAPAEAPHNPYRGVALSERQQAVEDGMQQLHSKTDLVTSAIMKIWQQGLQAPIDLPRQWLHGDMHARNVLVNRGEFVAIIDWGDITAGDVATDLAAVWSLFDSAEARQQVIAAYQPSKATLQRAMGWAVMFGVVLLNTGLVDHPRHARMGQQVLQRLAEDA